MKTRSYAGPIVATSAVALLACAVIPAPPRVVAGQVAIVTGGSRGLGLAIARRFGRAGVKLVLVSRKLEELERARASLLQAADDGSPAAVAHAHDVLVVAADLTDRAQAERIVAETIARFGRLDILINNAGIIEVGPMENQPIEAYERAMAISFFATLSMVNAALPHLLRAPSRRPRAIVNIASIGGKMAVPHLLPYTAAKFALTGYSEGLHAELRRYGIRVTTVCPGLMRTGGEIHAKFHGHVQKEQRWFDLAAKSPLIATSAEAAAEKIFFAVRAGRAEITISPQAWLAARLYGILPEAMQFANAAVHQFILPDPIETDAALPRG